MANADTSTRVNDDSAGAYIATRQAVETDGSGNVRQVQIVDIAIRPRENTRTIRGSSSPISSADGIDLDNLPADLLNNLIHVGDSSILSVEVEHLRSNGWVKITPIIFDSTGTTVLGVRSTKKSGMGTALFQRGSGRYVSPE